jgi:hypothetical protein
MKEKFSILLLSFFTTPFVILNQAKRKTHGKEKEEGEKTEKTR